jgi:hypothetical protein
MAKKSKEVPMVEPFVEGENAPVRCAFSEIVDPRKLKPHPENPNFHPRKQVEMYLTIIRGNGWRRPITVSTNTGFIVKGHGATQAAIMGGFTEVPVDYQTYDSYEMELADLLADNQLGAESQQNKEKIQEIMSDLLELDFNTDLTGFSKEALEKLAEIDKPKKDKKDKDTAIEHLPEFIISVTLQNEEEQREVYEELVERGYVCKII